MAFKALSLNTYLVIFILVLLPSWVFPKEILTKNPEPGMTGFIENKGQIIDQNNKSNPSVLFLLNTPGMNVQLRRDGFSYDLYRISNIEQRTMNDEFSRNKLPATDHELFVTNFHRIDFDLLNANPSPFIIPSDPAPDYYNYFTSNVSAEGVQNVRQYRNIIYKNIYPGIDLEFVTSKEFGYKYNFVIHPGAKINDIRLKIDGPEHILLNRDTLKFGTRFGVVEELIPESYYMLNHSRVNVRVSFIRISEGIYGFSTDKAIPANAVLLIDPTAVRLWGTYYGGSGWDSEAECSADKYGNVFLAGGTNSTNNIATSGSYQGSLAGSYDVFLVKFNAAGQRQWGTYIGGTDFEEVISCVVDKSGNIYVSGDTKSTSGIASPGAHQTVYGGGENDCFIEKFNTNGQRLWGTYYGGENSDGVGNITVDKNKDVFLSGGTSSVSGISTPGAYQPNRFNSSMDAFLAKFDSNGVRIWGTYYGGENDESAISSSADSLGNVYFSGNTGSTANISSPGSYQPALGGAQDNFLVKFSSDGNRRWATYYGGNNNEIGGGCSSDSAGNVCMTARTNSSDGIASPGCHQPLPGGDFDAYLVLFDSDGQRLWGTYYGGFDYDEGISCAFGSDDDIFITGVAESPNSISTPDSYQPVFAGTFDAFLAKFNFSGQLQWGTYYGGTAGDDFTSCSYVRDDTIYVAGYTYSTSGIASPGAHQEVYGGNRDVFLVKFIECWPLVAPGPVSGPTNVCINSTGITYSVPVLPHTVTYVWTLPSGAAIASGAGTNSITVDFSGSAVSGNIGVHGVNKCGTPGESAYLAITMHPLPVPDLSGPDNTCAGPGKIYSTDPGMINYQWSTSSGGMITGGGTIADYTATIQWNVAGPQQVYVNYTDMNGCSAPTPSVFNVLVTPSPAVEITINASSSDVCLGTLVTFTATPTNGGNAPAYQWKVNGINTGTDSPSFSYTPMNSDQVLCVLTSNASCSSNNPATSNMIIMQVYPPSPVSVTVATTTNPVCTGTSVTFTATPVNGGTNPAYQWKVNGINAGTNNAIFTYAPLNGDQVNCLLTSDMACTLNNPATSNPVTMTISPLLPVSVSIAASDNPFCLGQSVTLTATPLNPGLSPTYEWIINSSSVFTAVPVYTYQPASDNIVTCILTSSEVCTTGNPATSNTVMLNANQSLPAGISITASANPVCSGLQVTYTAIPVNGGSNPVFKWKVNGLTVGGNGNTYLYIPLTGDKIRCEFTSNLDCVTGNPAISNEIAMAFLPGPELSFSACMDTITTTQGKPFRLKGGLPLGGTYSGPGVNSAIAMFDPQAAGVGVKVITYSYTNAAQCSNQKSRSIYVQAPPAFNCQGNLRDVRDNQLYPTFSLPGGKCWMAMNLNYGTFIQGNEHQTDNCQVEKYCSNNQQSQCQTYGGFYQWDELMRFSEAVSTQGLCPAGWHIPTAAEWDEMLSYNKGAALAGGPLQDITLNNNFQAILGGIFYMNSIWSFIVPPVTGSMYWTSTTEDDQHAVARGLNAMTTSVTFYQASKANAFAVRCLRDN